MKHWMTLGLVVLLAVSVALVGCKKSDSKSTPPIDKTGGPTEKVPVAQAPGTDRQPDEVKQATPPAADPAYVTPGTQAAIAKAIDYLKKSQLPDGGWPMKVGGDKSDLGVTTVVANSLLTAGLPGSDPTLVDACKYIVGFVKEDGGIYGDVGLNNYTTSIGLMVLKAADAEKHKDVIAKALGYLRNLQWGRGQGLEPESADFGGAGYGEHERPDLSNTAWFVEAMKKMGVEKDDPAMKNAVIFVSRMQAGEAAKGYWVSDGKGGFIYALREGGKEGGGESKAGTIDLPSGGKGLKCYGSMTYAGFLSLIYAGLERTDPRVKAAHEWMEAHWTLEENPEMGMEGYLYYLMTMGKALGAYGSPAIIDEQGQAHLWQKELSAKLIALQTPDGSWVNEKADRWYEGNALLATPFALVGLDACKAKL